MDFTALDAALLGGFFISYSVLTLVQVSNLFSKRFVTFVVICGIAALVALGFRVADFSGFCAERQSAIICGGEGRGLAAFGMIWVFVCLAALGMFGLVRALLVLKGRRL